MLEQLPVPTKPFREMTPQEKADYRAAETAWAEAAVKKTLENMEKRTLDIIFAGKRSVTRAMAERRLRVRAKESRRPPHV